MQESDRLILGHMWIARDEADMAVLKFARSYDYEDIYSAALYGLVKAARSFNGGGTFGCWARLKIKYAILDWSRINGMRTERSGINKRPEVEPLNGTQILQWREEEPGTALDVHMLYDKVMANVGGRERRLLERRFADGVPTSELCEEFDRSEANLYFRISETLKHLRSMPHLHKLASC